MIVAAVSGGSKQQKKKKEKGPCREEGDRDSEGEGWRGGPRAQDMMRKIEHQTEE